MGSREWKERPELIVERKRNCDYIAGYTEMKRRASRARRAKFFEEELTALFVFVVVAVFFLTMGVQVGRYLERQEANEPFSQEMNR